MHHRVLYVSNPAILDQHLSAIQLRVKGRDPILIPFEDVGVIVLDGTQHSITAQLISACAQYNIAIVFTSDNHLPSSLLLPVAAHTQHPRILRQQIVCSAPKSKRLWQQVVSEKVSAQAGLLRTLNKKSPKIEALIPKILSGDKTNIEGQAASLYWPKLMGKGFYRDFNFPGINAMLNYGYAILRAIIARSLCGAGLHPALGIHHHHRENAFALADDAMEPLRPLVDALVYHFLQTNPEPESLAPAVKRFLVQITVLPVNFAGNECHILDACEKYAASLRRGICEDARKIQIPTPIWSAVIDKCGSW